MDDHVLQALLIKHEGWKDRAYQDSRGIWTVGVGHNLNNPLSHAAIQQIFQDDLADAQNQCLHAFPWFAELTDARQMAMIDLCFNLGLHGLLGFKKFLAAMADGDYATAQAELLNSEWAKQVQAERRDDLAALLLGAEQDPP